MICVQILLHESDFRFTTHIINSISYASDFELSIYNPEGSSTSKKITCNNMLCAHRNQCSGTFSNCPYSVSYVSAQTSTSGILVEDVLHLSREDYNQDNESVEAYVTFEFRAVLF